MKILILGNNSRIGSQLCQSLAKRNYVKCAGRNRASLFFDITKEPILGHISERFDIVINCVAKVESRNSQDNREFFEINMLGIKNAVRLSEMVGAKRLLHLSTISTLYTPESRYYNYYSVSKRFGDEFALLISKVSDIEVCIVRLTQVYGPTLLFQNYQPGLYKVIRDALTQTKIIIPGTRNAHRNLIHIDDVLSVLEKALKVSLPTVSYLHNALDTTVLKIADEAMRAAGKGCEIKFDERSEDLVDIPKFPGEQSILHHVGGHSFKNLKDGILGIMKELSEGKKE
jgi:nucleoside-diphosphate-sugar epimerase